MAVTLQKRVQYAANERLDLLDKLAEDTLRDSTMAEYLHDLLGHGDPDGRVITGFRTTTVVAGTNTGFDIPAEAGCAVARDGSVMLMNGASGIHVALTTNAINYVHAYFTESNSEPDSRRFYTGGGEVTQTTNTRYERTVALLVTTATLGTPAYAGFSATHVDSGVTRQLIPLYAITVSSGDAITAVYDYRPLFIPGASNYHQAAVPDFPFNQVATDTPTMGVSGLRPLLVAMCDRIMNIDGATNWWGKSTLQVSNWFEVPTIAGSGGPFNGMVYDSFHGVFIAVGGASNADTIWRSVDGINWTDISPTGTAGLYFNGVACNQTTGVVCACGHETATGKGVIYRATDGGAAGTSSFSIATVVTLDKIFYGIASDQAATNSVWLCVGETGTIERSANDGAAWTAQTSGTTWNLYCVDYNGVNLWCMAGAVGTILTTPTGSTGAFTTQTSGTTDPLYAVTHANSTWLTAGLFTAGSLTSSNGTTWTRVYPSAIPSGAGEVRNFIVNGSVVVAVGTGGVGNGFIASTTDMSTWQARYSGVAGKKCGAFGKNVFAIGEITGTILNSLRTA